MVKIKSSYKSIILWVFLALAWGVGVALTFLTWNTAPPAVGVFIEFAAAAVILTVIFGPETAKAADALIEDFRKGRRRDVWLSVVAALALALSFLFAIITRHGYAPSGSDIVFLLATSPVFVIIFSWLAKTKRLSLGRAAGSAAAILGSITVVGNWERPSSFSPFSRFPVEEAFLIASAILLAAFIVILWRLAKTRSAVGSAIVILWLTLPILLIIARILNGWAGFSEVGMDGYAILAGIGVVGVAVPIILLARLTTAMDAGKAAAAVFLSPVIITMLIGVEKLTGVAGAGIMATPFAWAPVIAGCVIVITGVVAIWTD